MVENGKVIKNFGDYLAGMAHILKIDFLDYSNRAELSAKIAEISINRQRGEMPWLDYSRQKSYSNILEEVPTGDTGRLIKSLYDLSEEVTLNRDAFLCYAKLQKGSRPKLYTLETLGVALFVDEENLLAYGDKIRRCWPKVEEFKPEYDEEQKLRCIERFCGKADGPKRTGNYERLEQVKDIIGLSSKDEITAEMIQNLSVDDFRKKGYPINARAISGLRGRLKTAKI